MQRCHISRPCAVFNDLLIARTVNRFVDFADFEHMRFFLMLCRGANTWCGKMLRSRQPMRAVTFFVKCDLRGYQSPLRKFFNETNPHLFDSQLVSLCRSFGHHFCHWC